MFNDRPLAELEADFTAAARAAAAGGAAAARLTTLLHIGAEHAVVLSGHGEMPKIVRRLDLGASRIASDFFRHDPPASQEIERAIDRVEDEVMQLRRAGDAPAALVSTDHWLQEWAAVSGPTMPIETIEQWFQRLASASLGEPGAMQGLPAGREAAAALLVLREFMHHLGYVSIAAVVPVRW